MDAVAAVLRNNFSLIILGVVFWVFLSHFWTRFSYSKGPEKTNSGFFVIINLLLLGAIFFFLYNTYGRDAAYIFLVVFVVGRALVVVFHAFVFVVCVLLCSGGVAWFVYDRLSDSSLSWRMYNYLSPLNFKLLIGVGCFVVLKALVPVVSYMAGRYKPDLRFWAWVGVEVVSVVCAVMSILYMNWFPVLAAFAAGIIVNMFMGRPVQRV
ncbi:MAG TPA: hypothetical protein PKY78_08235 [Candidatus Omnitrophota bacterium]|nr:hypothetical protein [Candidatus Omnitrophota bacterium]